MAVAGNQKNEQLDPIDPFTLRYKVLGEIGEGSYSKVLKCRRRESGELFACKRLKHAYRSWGQVADIPEIVTLRKLVKHPNILQMSEIHFDPNMGRVSLVFELMDMNLYELIKDRKRLLQENRVRNMIFQLIRGLRHLHKHGIFHRDVKPENILLKRMEEEEDEILKLGDLGSVRGLYSRPPYTEYISTRWYRSPECLLTPGFYSIKMDIWATGCVFYEVLTLRPLFPGASEVDQINRIHNIVGPPPSNVLTKFMKHVDENRNYPNKHSKVARFDNIKKTLSDLKNGNGKGTCDWYFGGNGGGVERLLPNHISPDARDLLATLLQYDPELRPTAHRAMAHPYFQGLREASRLKLHGDTPAEVMVSIGSSLKTLAEVEGLTGDLRTLGDVKSKRLPREVPSRIPVRLPRQGQSVTGREVEVPVPPPVAPPPPGPPVGLKLRKTSSINNYNLNNIDSVISGSKEEIQGKKVKSYDEFSQKSKGSLPYEIVHIDQHRPYIHPHPNQVQSQAKGGQVSESALTTAHAQNPRAQGGPTPRRPLQVQAQGQARMDVKASSEAQLIQPHSLTPATLRRINENRRLAQLEPITSVHKSTQDFQSPVNEKRRESTPLPSRRVHPPSGKLSFQFGTSTEENMVPDRGPIREHKSLQIPDLNWNYRKVREENLSPPPLTQRVIARQEAAATQLKSRPRIEGNVKGQQQPSLKPSLLDYQQFSARYKEKGSQILSRRREEIIPSPDSSSSDYNNPSTYQRHHQDTKTNQRHHQDPVLNHRRTLQLQQPIKTSRTKYKLKEDDIPSGVKMSRLKEFIQTNLVNQSKDKESELIDENLQEIGPKQSNSRDFLQQQLQHRNVSHPHQEQTRDLRKFGQTFENEGSEGVLGGNKKSIGQDSALFTSNSTSYYPSLQGRIRVSKPSLAIRSPSSNQLHPPPLIRHSDKIPFSLNLKNPRDPPKFQRETLTKKKYSFLHEKQDFLFTNNKSKLG